MIGSGAITASARGAVLRRAPIDPERARDLRLRIRAALTTALNTPPTSSGFRLRIRAVGRHRKIKIGDWRQPWLRVAGALLLVVSACIHLVLYLTGYRSIPTIGWLFLVQFVVAFVLAIGALVTHSRLVAVAGAAFALSTLGCYLLAVWIGLFGFREIRTRAGIAAGLIEVAAFATLALAAVITDESPAADPAQPGPRMLAGVRAAFSLVVGAVGAVSVAALVLFGIAVASAGGEPAAAADRGGVTLKTATIGGVTVLTNAKGVTLYWFAPDTSTSSKCTGSCAAYWPPVTGSPTAGSGVTGRLGTIMRPGGTEQATYDGHPLYTYLGDSAPGQANGNKLDLNGGYWYEVRVSG
jgi:predicted lipoprotein with Yx(FWY)xxD motif